MAAERALVDRQELQTTTFSLEETVPSPEKAERRQGKRHLTLFRVGAIEVSDERQLCLIKNISAGGMMIRHYGELVPDQPIAIELKSGEPVRGTVTWERDCNAGIAFDTKIDVIEILSQAIGEQRPRLPRIEIERPVMLYYNGQPHEARIVDISQGGVKLAYEGPLPPRNEDVGIALPGLAPIRGAIKWQRDEFAGVNFNSLMPLRELVEWLKVQRDGMRKTA